jgi:hypothetical protein
MSFINNLYNMLPTAVVKYVMSRKAGEPILVSRWLKENLERNATALDRIIKLNGLKGSNDDITVVRCLRWVKRTITYTSDSVQYKDLEYWANVEETLKSKKGDCEDGAALLFCLCRRAGVSGKKLFLTAGSVDGGGHSWIRYVSENYPFVAYPLDWCYWYNGLNISRRPLYYDYGSRIFDTLNRYWKYWFFANDEQGFR